MHRVFKKVHPSTQRYLVKCSNPYQACSFLKQLYSPKLSHHSINWIAYVIESTKQCLHVVKIKAHVLRFCFKM